MVHMLSPPLFLRYRLGYDYVLLFYIVEDIGGDSRI